ncbi:MAG: hypothetical protein K2F70_00110, partial [Muribaculaceae bacterium]|nr:hypothetical protein [Muribaculaceae bacterium]
MLRYLLTYVLFLLIVANVNADAPNIPIESKVWPESPQARSFDEVMMPTPSLLTGACEFAVPLYTVDVEGFKIPLTLNYRSNGIKLTDEFRPVGYGWSLTPPLRITRHVLGRPDGFGENIADEIDSFTGYDYEKGFKCVNSLYSRGGGYDTAYDIYTIYLIDATLTVVY